jgi:hypothetical protein
VLSICPSSCLVPGRLPHLVPQGPDHPLLGRRQRRNVGTSPHTISGFILTSSRWRVEQALMLIVGVSPAFMRPPYGSINDQLLQIAAIRGQSLVLWDFDSGDSTGSTPAESMQAYTDLANSRPSSVLALNHEVYGECSQGYFCFLGLVIILGFCMCRGNCVPSTSPRDQRSPSPGVLTGHARRMPRCAALSECYRASICMYNLSPPISSYHTPAATMLTSSLYRGRGHADGTPILMDAKSRKRWREIISWTTSFLVIPRTLLLRVRLTSM